MDTGMITIIERARQMHLSAPALVILQASTTPYSAVKTLLEADHPADALSLLARLLPRRYAVAWTCQCARREPLDSHDSEGLALAQAWVRDPGEAQRSAALAFARTHRFQGIGAWVAAAAGWAGGNLNPGHAKPTPPPEHLCAIAAASALNYLAARVASQFDARRAAFVRDALGLLGAPDTIEGEVQ